MPRVRFRLSSKPLLAAALAAAVAAPAAALAGDGVHVLIVRENSVGSAAQAQSFVDRLVDRTAKLNGWTVASGSYAQSRTIAERHITAHSPRFGIFSLGAYLGLRTAHKLQLVGEADVRHAGGKQFHIVSLTASDLRACKGQALATNHAGDPRFIDGVVAGGDFTLSEFRVDATRRPVQTIKKVIHGEAACALIDDAQHAELAHIDGGSRLRSLWKSAELPSMVVVAFPAADEKQVRTFKKSLAKVCSGEGAKACDEAGIAGLASAHPRALAKLEKAYGD